MEWLLKVKWLKTLCQRNKKEITIFIQKLKDIWLKNPQVPFAQLIGYALRYGFCSFKKDIEVVLTIERLYNKKRILISPEIPIPNRFTTGLF